MSNSAEAVLEAWLEELCATPGMTALRDPGLARAVHVDDALTALPLLDGGGPLVDVGSGGGSPGIPIALARADLEVHLLETAGRKARFLERWAQRIPNVEVVHARAEDWGRGGGRDRYGLALARALGPPAVAAELALPLVAPGGRFVLYLGDPPEGLAEVASALAADLVETVAVAGSDRKRLAVIDKVAATPPRFPRRAGLAAKRPLRAA